MGTAENNRNTLGETRLDELGGIKDPQTVTSAGERLQPIIDGVVIRPAITHSDERGEICEIYNPAWGIASDPLVYVYAASVRPGRVKGWVYHKSQSDRMFVLLGFLKIVLFDLRPDSPTKGVLNEIFLSERNRGLLFIPAEVAHAVQNIGQTDAVFINMPDRPYNHADPDKYRLSRDRVPYDFDKGPGW